MLTHCFVDFLFVYRYVLCFVRVEVPDGLPPVDGAAGELQAGLGD